MFFILSKILWAWMQVQVRSNRFYISLFCYILRVDSYFDKFGMEERALNYIKSGYQILSVIIRHLFLHGPILHYSTLLRSLPPFLICFNLFSFYFLSQVWLVHYTMSNAHVLFSFFPKITFNYTFFGIYNFYQLSDHILRFIKFYWNFDF